MRKTSIPGRELVVLAGGIVLLASPALINTATAATPGDGTSLGAISFLAIAVSLLMCPSRARQLGRVGAAAPRRQHRDVRSQP